MRQHYEDDSNPKKRLKISDPDDEIDEPLHAALVAMKGGGSLSLLRAWFERKAKFNQKKVVVALRAAHDVSPAVSVQNATFIVGVMRWIVRNELLQAHIEEVKVCHSLFGQSLLKTWKVARRDSTMTTSDWYQAYEDIIHLVLPKRDVVKCVMCKDAWTTVEKELVAVCKSSSTGLHIFGRTLREAASSKVSVAIVAAVGRLMASEAVDAAAVDKEKLVVMAECEELGKDLDEGFAGAQDVVVSYRGRQFPIKVQSYAEHLHKQWLRWRGRPQLSRACWRRSLARTAWRTTPWRTSPRSPRQC